MILTNMVLAICHCMLPYICACMIGVIVFFISAVSMTFVHWMLTTLW